jgi:hypothetical protein
MTQLGLPLAGPAPPRFTDHVVAYFRARPWQWINAVELERVGGRQAWRTRVSEARHAPYWLPIRNRVRTVTRPDGSRYRLSEYRYEPEAET